MNEVNCTTCFGREGGSKSGDGRKDRGDNANVRIRSAIRTYGQLYLWLPVLALPVLTNRVFWLLSFGSIAMHEPVNSRHCRRDTDHASE